jgi:hypothetical protein
MATRLNPEVEHDIWEIFHKSPYIGIAKDAFMAMVLKCPVKVTLKSFTLMQSEELSVLLSRFWLEWKQKMYIWLKMYGICPWYFIKVKKTIHKYPLVPPLKSGYISTFLDKKKIQQYTWTWHDGGEDKKMHFETRNYPPTIFGEFTTPIISIMPDYRSLKIARKAVEKSWVMQSHPQHILEYKPDIKFHGENDSVVRYGNWEAEQHKRAKSAVNNYNDMNTIRIKNAQRAVAEAAATNRQSMCQTPYMESDSRLQSFEIANSNIFDKITPLPADYVYKAGAVPHVQANIIELSKFIDAKAAAIMDFPVHMMTGSTKTSAQADNNMRTVNEKIKDWLSYFENRTKNALLLVYGDIIQDELTKVSVKLADGTLFLVDKELIVEIACTPITKLDDLYKFYSYKIMSFENFAKNALNSAGISESQMDTK